jgi:hypothetical protein
VIQQCPDVKAAFGQRLKLAAEQARPESPPPAPAAALVLRHLLGVVDASDDDRLVRVAFEEVHDDFLTDVRPERRSSALARPHAHEG